MRVVLGFTRQVEVEHVRHVLHVDPARRHVRRDQHADATGTVAAHHVVALRLGKVAVDGIGVVAVAHQGRGQVLGLVFGAAEDDGEQVGIGIDETLQGRETVLAVYHAVLVLDGGRSAVSRSHAHLFELTHVAFGDAAHIAAHRGAEEPGLLVLGGLLQDLREVLLETHVQHLVGFVQYNNANGGQVHHPTADQVQQAAGCGHDDLSAALDVADLVADAGAAVHRYDARSLQIGAETLQVLGDLHAEFTGRGQDQALDRFVLRIQELQHGQAEGGRFAGAGLCQGHNILLGRQQQGNGLLLHGSRCGEADRGKGLEGFGT